MKLPHDHSDERPRPLILDFGMHRGEDTDFYLALGARVISFEANGALVAENRTVFRQQLASGRLRIVEGAVTAPGFGQDTIDFYVDRDKSIWGTTQDAWAARNARLGTSVDRITVPVVDLVGILSNNDTPYYVKIDIEGADRHVLSTLLVTGSCPEYLSIESDKTSLDAVAAEIDMLRAIGYTRFAAVQQGAIPGSTYRGETLYGRDNLRYRFSKHSSGCFGPMLRQEYKTAAVVMDDYRAIFKRYARFGDTSWLMRNPCTRLPTRVVNRALSAVAGRPLCGWFDTHACR